MSLTAHRPRVLPLLAVVASFPAALLALPVARASAAADPPALSAVSHTAESGPKPRRRSSTGVGLRVGSSYHSLDAGPIRSYIDDQGRKRGTDLAGQLAAEHMHDLKESAFTLAPSLHLGGSGYFFKAELPVAFASSFTSLGAGIYPLNYGLDLAGPGLFPYASLGLAAHAARGTGAQSGKWTGGFVQARGAAGLKWRASGRLAVSLEVGLARTAGLLSAPATESNGIAGLTAIRPAMDASGGLGHTMDVSLGVDLF